MMLNKMFILAALAFLMPMGALAIERSFEETIIDDLDRYTDGKLAQDTLNQLRTLADSDKDRSDIIESTSTEVPFLFSAFPELKGAIAYQSLERPPTVPFKLNTFSNTIGIKEYVAKNNLADKKILFWYGIGPKHPDPVQFNYKLLPESLHHFFDNVPEGS